MLRAKKAKAAATVGSGVTATGKRVAYSVPLEGVRGKRPRNVNVPGQEDERVTFEALAPPAPEVPRVRIGSVLEEAGMADDGIVRRMVADLRDAGTDRLLAQGATSRENRERMFRHLLRVSVFNMLR